MAKLQDLPPELVLRILSHLLPIHHFPLKVAGNHYLTQILRANLPPLSRVEWNKMREKSWLSPLNSREAAGIVQGRICYVEKLIGEIRARKRAIRDRPRVNVELRIGRAAWKVRWPQAKGSEVLAVDRLVADRLGVALWLAANAGSEYLVRMIMGAGVVEDWEALGGGEYSAKKAVFRAVLRGSVASARVMVEGGVRCDGRGEDGQTAFHIAAGSGDVEMMRILLDGLLKNGMWRHAT